MSSAPRSLAHRAKSMIGSRAAALRPLAAARMINPGWTVSAASDVCIDGYPRSGNSFAVRAFQIWNPEARIAHHVHLAGQIRAAVALGVPTAVPIRAPEDAVASHLVFADMSVSVGAALWSYRRFYEQIAPLAGQIALVPFEAIIADPSSVVEQLNSTFSTAFHASARDGELMSRVEAEIHGEERRRGDPIGRSAVPGRERDELRDRARALVRSDPGLGAAREAYELLLSTLPRSPAP